MSEANRENFEEQLSAYLDGELTDAERAEVERVLDTDPKARALLTALRGTVQLVQQLPRRPAPDTLIDDLTARIERAQLLDAPQPAAPGSPRRRSIWPMLASAAVVVFSVGGGLWVFRELAPPRHASGPVALNFQEKTVAPRAEPTLRGKPDLPDSNAAEETITRLKKSDGGRAVTETERSPTQTPIETDKLAAKVEPSPPVVAEKSRENKTVPHEAQLGRGLVSGVAADVKNEAAASAEAGQAGGYAERRIAPPEDALQLNVTLDSEADRTRLRDQLNAYFVANQIEPVPLAEGAKEGSRAGGDVAASAPDFARRAEINEPLVVEISAAQLADLVEPLTESPAGRRGINLEMGDFTVASGADRVREVLSTHRSKDRQLGLTSRPTDELARAGLELHDDRTDAAPVTAGAASTSQSTARGVEALALGKVARERDSDREQSLNFTQSARSSGRAPATQATPDFQAATQSMFAGEEVVQLVINFVPPPPASQAAATSQPAAVYPLESQPAEEPAPASQPLRLWRRRVG